MRKLEGVTPPEVAECIKDLIQGKVVCDVGCGEGTFMDALAKYAERVTGIEEEEAWAYAAADKGYEILWGSSWFQPLPKADVYYLWSRDAMGIFLKARYEGTKGTFVFGKTIRQSLVAFLEKEKAERRDVPGLDWWIYVTELT